MTHTMKNETDTPEARDALRLRALPMVLAIELAQHQRYLQSDELILHDDLEYAVRRGLGLELDGSGADLSEDISSQMFAWNWQWLNYEDGMQQFYACPERRRAKLATVWAGQFVLQADQVFPDCISDITENLWQTDFAAPFASKDQDESPCSESVSDEALVNAFLEAHLIEPLNIN